MVKNYSLPDEVGRVIGRALRLSLLVDVHIDLIGDRAKAMKIIEDVSRDEQRPVEAITGGMRVWMKRACVQYGICARDSADSTQTDQP